MDLNTSSNTLKSTSKSSEADSKAKPRSRAAKTSTRKHNPSEVRRTPSQEKVILEKYGITEDDYQRMLTEQRGVCAICQRHQRYQRLSIDHNHRTGKVRGLLCN